MNIPAIPSSVDATVRQAINELQNEVKRLQAALTVQANTQVSVTTTVSTVGMPVCPNDGRLWVGRNGNWEVLNIVGG